MTTTVNTSAPGDFWARRVRMCLLLCGTAVTLLAAVAVFGRIARGGTPGPTQLEIGAAGFVLLGAGLFRGPAARLARAFLDARQQRPVACSPPTGRQRGTLTAIVLLALVFRLVMIGAYWPSHQIVSGMPLWDAEMARNLLKGRGWTLNWEFVQRQDRAIVERGTTVDPEDFLPAGDERPGALDYLPVVHTPGYSTWLAMSFALGGSHRFVYSQWMQAALDSLACLLVFGIARRLWSPSAGMAGAYLYAVSPGSIYLAIQPVAAATDSFWVLLVGYGIVRLVRAVVDGRAPVVGLVTVIIGATLGTLMNTLSFTLALATAGGAVVIGLADRRAWRVAAWLVAAHLAVAALLVPWGLRNLRAYGQFVEMRATVWQHTWETLGAIPNPWGLQLITESGGKDDAWEKWIRENCPSCDQFERETFTRDYLLRNVFVSPRFPAHMIRLVAMQVPGIVYVSRLPAENPYAGSGIAGWMLAAALRVINFAALFLWPAALFGLALLSLRRSTALAGWLGVVPSAFLIVFSLCLFVEHRKTTQAYGYLIGLAGIACAACLHREADDAAGPPKPLTAV